MDYPPFTPPSEEREYWLSLGLPPATPAQLEKLSALYGLRLVLNDVAEFHSLYIGLDGPVATFMKDSPIERYIARITEWRREQQI